jgi:uncharacterized metal-binding protein YceD (DUF177 family)
VKDFNINIVGLSNKKHTYHFELHDAFFEWQGRQIVETGDFEVKLVLDKHPTFIEALFTITGHAHLICDRSLEPFDQPLDLERKLIFKYGDENKEVSEEIVVIARDTDQLAVAQYIYEFICLEIPIKKIHPRFGADDAQTDVGTIVYQSAPAGQQEQEDVIDPRWEKLKKLK